MTAPEAPGGGEHIGQVEVDVVPNAEGFGRKLRRQIDADSEQAGKDLGKKIAAPVGKQIADSVLGGVKDAGRHAKGAGEDLGEKTGKGFADRFGTVLTRGVARTLGNLPPIDMDVDDGKAMKAAARIRRTLGELSGKEIGVDISAEEAVKELARVRNQISALARDLQKLRATNPEIQVDVDALQAMASATMLQDQLKGLIAEQYDVDVDADTSAAKAKLTELGEHADRSTRDRTFGVDADLAKVTAKIATLGLRVDNVTKGRTVNVDANVMRGIVKAAKLEKTFDVAARARTVDVDVDTFAAVAKLAGFGALAAEATRDRTINLDVDSGKAIAGALAAAAALGVAASQGRGFAASLIAGDAAATMLLLKVGGLTVAVIALGAALVPMLAVAVALIGALAAGLTVAIAAIAVFAVGMIPIIGAFTALGKAKQEQAAHDKKVKESAEGLADAQRNLGQVNQSVARQIKSADQQVADSKRTLTAAIAQAARDDKDAAQRVRDSYRDLTAATKELEAAQLAVNAARQQAMRDSEDLASQVEHNAQDQRQNALDIADAQSELDAVMADPSASDEQRERAQLNYDRLTLQNRDLTRQAERLAQKQAEEAEKGVEGSDVVVAAKDREKRAEEQLEAKRAAHKRAQEDRTRTHVEGQQRIADANRGVANAEENARIARVTGAQQIEAAQRQVAKAEQAHADAVAGVGTAAEDARKKMGKLTAEAQSLVLFLRGLDFGPLMKAAQGFAGPLEKGLRTFIPKMMPTLTEMVGKISKAIGEAFGVLLEEFSSPFWQDFFTWLGDAAKDMLPGMAKGFADIMRGVAGLVKAFGPLMEKLGPGFGAMLSDFADWASKLGENKGFKKFIDYAVEMLPIVAAFFGSLIRFVMNLIIALAPIGAVVLKVLTAFLWLLGLIPPEVWTAIIGAIMLVVGAIIAWAIAQAALNAVMALNPFTWIVIAIIALVAALIYLYRNNEGFRTFVIAVWDAFLNAVKVAWGFIQPVLMLLWWIIKNVLGPIFLWIWKVVIVPVFKGIWWTIQFAWTIIKIIFVALVLAIKGIGAIFAWLYEKAIKPIWEKAIKPVFEKLGEFVEKHVKPPFEKGVEALKKVWDTLSGIFKTPVKFMIETVINKGIIGGLAWLAEKLKVPGLDIQPVPLPPGFAVGGRVRGGGTTTSDSILARLSKDEHVWTAKEVEAIGGHENMLALRRLALTGMLSKAAGFAGGGAVEPLPGFADGGWFGDMVGWVGDKAKSVKNTLTDFTRTAIETIRDPGKFLRSIADKLLALMPDRDSLWGKIVTAVPTQVMTLISSGIAKIKDAITDANAGPGAWTGTLSTEPLLKRMQEFALAQRGKTYRMTAVGPQEWDCSGLVGALWAIAHNKPPIGHRYMSTANMGIGRHGMVAGPGRFTVYLMRGHTAANIDGLHAEAHGPRGAKLAIGHVGTALSRFTSKLHLPELAVGGSPMAALTGTDEDRLIAFLKYGWPEPPISFDAGGRLPDTRALPGQVMPVYHGSRTPDAVLTDAQFNDLHTLATRSTGERAGGGVHIDHYYEQGADAQRVARELDWLSRGLG